MSHVVIYKWIKKCLDLMLKGVRNLKGASAKVLMFKNNTKFSLFGVVLILALVINISTSSISITGFAPLASASDQQKKQVTLTALLVEPKPRWDILIKNALQILRERHPDMDIQVNYTTFPYEPSRTQILSALSNKIPIDLISVDQIWLGDFAERGYLTDLTDYLHKWGRASDWYQANFDGGVYKGKVYGIWAWTDVRAMWYWKDLLNQAGVDPNTLKTWHGYIAGIKKLNAALRNQGIQGTEVYCDLGSASMWYPYLWMLGGDILVQKDGHPTKGNYWFPAYNSSKGIQSLQFIKDQVNAGLKPYTNNFDSYFKNKKVAAYLGGSWMPESFPTKQGKDLEKSVGMIPMFPVPKEGDETTTLLGGWELSVPQTSKNKDLAWELITIMLQPDILGPMLKQTGYLPTQKTIGEGPYGLSLNQTIPYYGKMLSMIPIGRSRPNIPEFPQIDSHVSQAIVDVCHGIKQPKQALDDAAVKSAKVLGWLN
jgi:multiple sugar transport system substrate-binding protein